MLRLNGSPLINHVGAVGSVNYIRELLLDTSASCQIFEGLRLPSHALNLSLTGCFLAGYGILDRAERDWIVDYHRKKKLNVFNKFAWEVDRLHWIRVSALKEALFPSNGDNYNDTFGRVEAKEVGKDKKFPKWRQERIRPFFYQYMKKYVDWDSDSSPMRLLIEGISTLEISCVKNKRGEV